MVVVVVGCSLVLWVDAGRRGTTGAPGVVEDTGTSGIPPMPYTEVRIFHSWGFWSTTTRSSKDAWDDRTKKHTWDVCDSDACGIHVTLTQFSSGGTIIPGKAEVPATTAFAGGILYL